RGMDLIAERLENLGGDIQYLRLILDDENRTGLLAVLIHDLAGRIGFRRHTLGGRQIDPDRRSPTLCAIDLHHATGLRDEAVDLAEPQSRPLADLLGGEEGI